MNIGIRGMQSKGKTALMVAVIRELLMFGGYSPDDVAVNFLLRIEGTHSLTNNQMRQLVHKMVTRGLRHKIIGITEIDRLFPARFWQQKEQTEALVGLWQDEKLFNYILWDAHIGSGVDLMLRETMQQELLPEINKPADLIRFVVVDTLEFKTHREVCRNISTEIFPYYDRWEAIGVTNPIQDNVDWWKTEDVKPVTMQSVTQPAAMPPGRLRNETKKENGSKNNA